MRPSLRILSLIGVCVSGAAIAIFLRLPDVDILKTRFVQVDARPGQKEPRISLVSSRPPTWVRFNQVSPRAIGAILVSEDWAFYQHKGFDWKQIQESMEQNLKAHKYVRGASTITQQVVKNVFLEKDKTLWRKLKELVLAVRLEQALTKKQILEIYLNVAEWGDGIYGIRQASALYFDKSPSELTAKEGAFLAMLLPSPKKYGVSFRQKKLTAFAERRIVAILEKMKQAQIITGDELMMEMATPYSFEELEIPVPPPTEEEAEEESNWL